MTVRLLLLQIVLLLSKAYGFMDLGKIDLYLPLIVLFVGYNIWALLRVYDMFYNYIERKNGTK